MYFKLNEINSIEIIDEYDKIFHNGTTLKEKLKIV